MIATLTTLSAIIKYMMGVAPTSSKMCLDRSTMFEFMGARTLHGACHASATRE
jgi:hypothetical protein